MPELEAHRKGRDILLAFQNDVGLSHASQHSDAIILAKVLRTHMVDYRTTLDARSHEWHLEDSIPPVLLQFVYGSFQRKGDYWDIFFS